jgi:hypothetical protein
MAAQPIPTYRIDFDHCEQLFGAISALTVDPAKSLACYLFPFIGAFFSNQLEVRPYDRALSAMMPPDQVPHALGEIRLLKEAAHIHRDVIVHTSLNHTFASFGGTFSLTSPSISIPYQHLFSPSDDPLWNFSENEVRFLIARELARITGDDELLRIGIKVSFVASIFFLFAIPLGAIPGILLMIGSATLYLFSERGFQAQMDQKGVEILARHLNNLPLATAIARTALEKMRQQNLQRLRDNSLCRYYITQNGNNLLDLNRPFLTSRIEALA